MRTKESLYAVIEGCVGAAMGVNEYGNDAVSTWKRYGYRQ